jgi:hypothetical protein
METLFWCLIFVGAALLAAIPAKIADDRGAPESPLLWRPI